MSALEFPKNFYWGAATSAHQVEGGNHNDWSEWEHANGVRLAAQAARKEWPDYLRNANPSPLNPENYISGRACDHYHRFREDFDIAKSLGHNAHRFSIEWSRIEPEEGRFSEKEIEHYREVIRALRERGMEPFVTLWHWTLPLWLRDKGGIYSKEFPKYFTRYCEKIVNAFSDEVRFWITLNEPTVIAYMAYARGEWPPQRKSYFAARRAYKILAEAHCRAYEVIHKLQKDAEVGFANNMNYIEPASMNIANRFAARIADFWTNEYFHRLTFGYNDFLALQYYMHRRIAFPARVLNENKWTSDMGWEIYPEGIYHLLLRLARYKKPIYITENGIADARDIHRAKFIREHLEWMVRAIQDGVDVRGYFYWSLLDNFEWDKGFWPRFGLVEVDYNTFERKIRPSAWEYKKIIEKLSTGAPFTISK